MKLGISAAAEDRNFSRNFRRVRRIFDTLIQSFSQIEMINPIHEAILIGVTDSKPDGYFVEVPNRDGFFQVLAGVDGTMTQDGLVGYIFSIIERAVTLCQFSVRDRHSFMRLLAEWREANFDYFNKQA